MNFIVNECLVHTKNSFRWQESESYQKTLQLCIREVAVGNSVCEAMRGAGSPIPYLGCVWPNEHSTWVSISRKINKAVGRQSERLSHCQNVTEKKSVFYAGSRVEHPKTYVR